jgi:transposase
MQITTIGLDIAKNVFQIHGIDAAEKVIVRKQLRRGQVTAFFEALAPCLGRHGGLCHVAPLGARVDEARP